MEALVKLSRYFQIFPASSRALSSDPAWKSGKNRAVAQEVPVDDCEKIEKEDHDCFCNCLVDYETVAKAVVPLRVVLVRESEIQTRT